MANEATKLTIGGVEHNVMDAEARRLIALLQAALDAMTGTDTTTAIETFQEVLDFLAGVTDDETLVGKITALQTAISGKVDKEPGKGLSSNDYTDADKEKVGDLPTKAELDESLANAGKVKSVTVNGTNYTPDSNGNVDLGTIQGAKGDKGDKGDTVVINPEGLVQFEIANDLDTSDPTQGLSARQGKILKQAVDRVQANLQAVVDALAGIAFTELPKPALTPIDWTGGTFYATIKKTLNGCTTQNMNTEQVAEGQQFSMVLSALTGYTLTGAVISVTNSKAQSVAYTFDNNTLTIAAANVVGTINISVTAIGVFSVTNSDTHVDLTTQNMSPTTGSSWSGTLAIKSGVSGYGLSATPNVTMGGSPVDFTASGNSWDQSTGVMTIGSVMGDIVIVSASSEVVAHEVTKKLLNMTSGNSGDTTDQDFGYKHNSVVDGENYTDTIAPVSGAAYNNDLKVYVGGVLLTADTDYTYTNNVLSIPAAKVTGDITIIATAATGTITVRSNTSGTTATVGGTTITCDTADGNEFVGTASGITTFSALSFSDKTKITSLDFGGAKFTGRLYSSTGLFQGMTALTSLVGLVISGTNTLRQAFSGCSALAVLQTIGWDTSSVRTDYTLFQIFMNCSSLTKIDLEYFIRSGAGGAMQECFKGCSHLSEIRGLSSWITNGVSSLLSAFRDCRNITELDMRGWNTAGLTGMDDAFNKGGSLTIKIGQEFNTSKVNPSDYISGTTSLVIEIHSETPPAVNTSNVWFGRVYNWQSNLTIKVPSSALDTYKETEGYSTYQSVITTL